MRVVYLGLREWLPSHSKELQACRQRFTALRNSCIVPPVPAAPAQPAADLLAAGMWVPLLPRGCQTVDDAATQLCQRLTPQELDAFDAAVQEALKRDHPSLAALCIRSTDTLSEVLNIMAVEAEKFLGGRVQFPDIAQLFVGRYPDFLAQSEAMTELFHAAAPAPGISEAGDEISIVALPKSPTGNALVKAFQAALPQTQIIQVENADEIALYREVVNVDLQVLPQLGEAARKCYDMAVGVENFTPHSRQDVTWK
jgi:hypothetical protein